MVAKKTSNTKCWLQSYRSGTEHIYFFQVWMQNSSILYPLIFHKPKLRAFLTKIVCTNALTEDLHASPVHWNRSSVEKSFQLYSYSYCVCGLLMFFYCSPIHAVQQLEKIAVFRRDSMLPSSIKFAVIPQGGDTSGKTWLPWGEILDDDFRNINGLASSAVLFISTEY